jgi:hypothetical protein
LQRSSLGFYVQSDGADKISSASNDLIMLK